MNLLEEFKKFKEAFLEATKDNRYQPQPSSVPIKDPQFLFCDLWRDSYKKNKTILGVLEGVEKFIKDKGANPLAPFGSKDDGFSNPSIYPKILHTHITRDVSIFFKLEGAHPRRFLMYAVLTHKQSGTGTPQNIKIQKSMTKSMLNQTFTPEP